MKKIILPKILGILFAAILFGIPAFATAGEVVWAVDSSSDSLYKIDVGTGNVTLIDRLHPDLSRFKTPVSMAVHPVSGVIYINNNSPDGDDGLATVDPESGLATLVNPIGGPGGDYIDGAMAFDDLGTLYAADSNRALAIVDQNTGGDSPIGGLPLPRLFGLDFNPADNRLYGITTDGESDDLDLLIINPMTGALEDTITLSLDLNDLGGTAPQTLLFDSAGTLHGTTNASNLFEIDTSTGTVSNIRTVTPGFSPQGMGLMVGTAVEVTVPVPDGENIIIDPGFITAIAENVVQAGTIDFEFCVAILDSTVGKQAVSLSRFSNTGTCGELHDVFMPVGFEPYLNDDGKLAVGVVTADSNVLFDGLILETQDIVAVLGRDLACSTDVLDLDDPRVLGLSDLDFLPKAMHLQTGECNRPRSVRATYSTTVFPLRFTGDGRMLAFNQVKKVEAELREASCITRSVLAQLKRTAIQIKRNIKGNRFLSAQDKFIEFALIAQNNPDAFVSCPLERNFRGLFTSDGIIGAFIVSEEILDNRFVIPPEINLPEEEEPEE